METQVNTVEIQDQQERQQRCIQRIQEVLDEEKCIIIPSMTILPDRIIPKIDVVPVNEDQQEN